ncbi:MAG: GHKL domain-containing protein [Magnetococcales bacterium]|nr:GHKL domain-containing protein [Magnetococcales bacterium]
MNTQIKNIIKIALTIALSEGVIMVFLSEPDTIVNYSLKNEILKSLLDPVLLTICTVPLVYFLVIKPYNLENKACFQIKTIIMMLVLIIFIAELFTMTFLYWLQHDLTVWQSNVIDSIFVTLLCTPLIDYLVLQRCRPHFSNQTGVGKAPYIFIISIAIILAILVFIVMAGIETLSGLRAFVGAEGLWSKSQKGAVIHLVRYAVTREDREYEIFQKLLEKPLGDKQARLELEKENPDLEVAYEGLIQGGNHPNDVRSMAYLFREFRHFDPIDRAVRIWEQADGLITQLDAQGKKMYQLASSGVQISKDEIEKNTGEILILDHQLTTLEDDFSLALGEASRWANKLLFLLMAGSTAIVLIICVWLILFTGKIFGKLQSYNDDLLLMSMDLKKHTSELEEMVQARSKQLIHAERLATLGTFSAGMAHEINNPNSFILGNIEFLKQYWGIARPILNDHQKQDATGRVGSFMDEVEATLEGMQDGCHRISKIVNSLKSYSRGGMEADKVECRLMEPVTDAQYLLQHRLKKGFTLTLDVPKDLYIVCDRQQMSQVFVNLINNAMDALETMGEDYEKQIRITGEILDNHIWIRVIDNGPGIPEDAEGRIFDPFYTSKGKTKGTGLGLSIVHGIIEDHAGQITAYSTSTRTEGAELLIILPNRETYLKIRHSRKRS